LPLMPPVIDPEVLYFVCVPDVTQIPETSSVVHDGTVWL